MRNIGEHWAHLQERLLQTFVAPIQELEGTLEATQHLLQQATSKVANARAFGCETRIMAHANAVANVANMAAALLTLVGEPVTLPAPRISIKQQAGSAVPLGNPKLVPVTFAMPDPGPVTPFITPEEARKWVQAEWKEDEGANAPNEDDRANQPTEKDNAMNTSTPQNPGSDNAKA